MTSGAGFAGLVARVDRAVAPVASTRAVSLLRILLVLIAWSRWANELLLIRVLTVDRIVLSVVFFCVTTWLLVGYHTRLAAIAAAAVVCQIVFGYGHWGYVEDWSHHHTTVLAYAFVGLAFTPCGRSLSLDRWLAVRRAEREGVAPPPERGNLLGATLIGVHVSTVYLWSAFDKTSVAFLTGERLDLVFVEYYSGSDWPTPALLRALFAVAGVTVVVLEYVLPFGLWVRRLHWWLIPAGLLLHGLFYVMIPVSTFTVTMWSLYLVFLDPDAVHRAMDRMLSPSRP